MASIVTQEGNQPETNNGHITLIPKDGVRILISKKAAMRSVLLKSMVNLDDEDGESDQDIPLVNVDSKTLEKIIEFLNHRIINGEMEKVEKPLSKKLSLLVSPWDHDFISKLKHEELFELIQGSNYLDIKDLLDLSCAQVASIIKGRTPEEIRKTFNIVNDFTPEEEAQVREENKWAEDL